MKRDARTPQELAARAVNDQPWAAPTGYWKRRCERCSYWFATPARRQAAICPDCRLEGVGRGNGGRAA